MTHTGEMHCAPMAVLPRAARPRRLRVAGPTALAGVLLACGLATTAAAQTQSYDGRNNNIANPDFGAADTWLNRVGPFNFGDGISTPAGAGLPNPRTISNALCDQGNQAMPGKRVLTATVFTWGQFIDHDIDLSDPHEHPIDASMMIHVPAGDPDFDPTGTGQAMIPFLRAIYDDNTGTDTANPRRHINQITSWIDGSMVYGHSETRAHALRSFTGGRMQTSTGDMLPWVADVDVPMANPLSNPVTNLWAAGDVRASEQPGLACLHTLFLREHNRRADELAAEHPAWTDEQVYQAARRWTIAHIQAITFNEFLPALAGSSAVPAYSGYDAATNPGISAEFSAASYRFGHSMVNPLLHRMNEDGTPIAAGPLDLFTAFFNPAEIVGNGGIEPIFRGMVSQAAQEIDTKVIDDLRNLLFGAASGGLDLAAVNIQRGRDMGVASYNDMREAMGLTRVTSFAEISSDPQTQASFAEVYASPDDIDLWVGGLAEDHLPGSSLGPLLQAVLMDQFLRLRDCDRFWYENLMNPEQIAEVNDTRLSDIIKRNTSIERVQANVFFVAADFSGDGVINFADVQVFLGLFGTESPQADLTGDGVYNFADVQAFLGAFGMYLQ